MTGSETLKFSLEDDAVTPPFFVVSAGRSGTTLLRRMLLAQGHIHIPPESDRLIPHMASHFILNNNAGWSFLVESILDSFQRARCFKFWDANLLNIKNDLIFLPAEHRSYARIIYEVYRYHATLHNKNPVAWGDKTPILIYHIELLRHIFPKAKFIHMVRDGRAVVCSLMKNLNYTMEQATTRWKESIHLFQEHLNGPNERQFLQVRYEDLIADAQSAVKRICEFLSVTYVQDMTYNIPENMGDTVLLHHANVHKPLTKEPLSHWREHLSNEEFLYLSRLFETDLKNLGYA